MSWGAVAGAAVGAIGSIAGSKKEAGGYQDAAAAYGTLAPIAEEIALGLQTEGQAVRDKLGATATEVRDELTAFGDEIYAGTQDVRDLRSSTTAQLEKLLAGDFEETAGYQFLRDEALQATERAYAARGGNVGGGVLRGLSDAASGMAAKEYTNQLNSLTQLLGTSGGVAGQADALATGTRTNALNMYSQLITQGELSGSALYAQGQQTKGNMLTSAVTGQAQAAVGQSQAEAQGLSTLAGATGSVISDIWGNKGEE